jgi:hypothetical protein
VSRFTLSKRHGVKSATNELLSHPTAGFDFSRQKAGSAFNHTLFFELLRGEVNHYGVEPWTRHGTEDAIIVFSLSLVVVNS